MITTSEAWKEYSRNNNLFHIKAQVLKNNATAYNLTDSDFMMGTVKLSDSTSNTSSFDVGSVITNTFECTLNNFSGKFDGFDFSGAIMYISFGTDQIWNGEVEPGSIDSNGADVADADSIRSKYILIPINARMTLTNNGESTVQIYRYNSSKEKTGTISLSSGQSYQFSVPVSTPAYFRIAFPQSYGTEYLGDMLLQDWMYRGFYTVDKPTSLGSTIQIKAYDYMDKLNKYFASVTGISYPITSKNLGQAILTACGVGFYANSWWKLPNNITVGEFEFDESITCRAVLNWLMQINGGYARIFKQYMECHWYDTSTWEIASSLNGGSFWAGADTANGGTIVPWAVVSNINGGTYGNNWAATRVKEMSVDTDSITITGIRAYAYNTVDEFQFSEAGDSGYILKLEGNPLINETNMASVATAVNNAVGGTSFKPFSATIFGDPSMEAGDTITIYDYRGVAHNSIITNLTFTIDGLVQISCGAETPTENNREFTNPNTGVIQGATRAAYDYIAARKISAGIINAGVLQSQESSTNPKFYLNLDNGVLRMNATELQIVGEDIADYVDGRADSVADGVLDDFILGQYASDLQNLQAQIDGEVTSWFYDYVPTTSNAPASDWTTTALKDDHLGDLFYDTTTGYCYRWQKENGVYGWGQVSDSDIAVALQMASQAQDTADHKRRVFVTTPFVPYDVGDLWTDGSDLLRCQTAKTSSQTYSASDWIKATNYVDIGDVTAITNVLVQQIDAKIETWAQNSNPATAWTTTALRTEHNGDLWYYTGTATITTMNPNIEPSKTYQYNGTNNTWSLYNSPSESLFDLADGKTTIFYGSTSGSYDAEDGDYLVDSSSGSTYRYNGTTHQWVTQTDYAQAIQNYDSDFNQEKVFNRLTNNGTAGGLFIDPNTHGVYLNATYIKSGVLTGGTAGQSGYYWLGIAEVKNATINGVTRNDWRFILGTKFGVSTDGILYATDGHFSGDVDANSFKAMNFIEVGKRGSGDSIDGYIGYGNDALMVGMRRGGSKPDRYHEGYIIAKEEYRASTDDYSEPSLIFQLLDTDDEVLKELTLERNNARIDNKEIYTEGNLVPTQGNENLSNVSMANNTNTNCGSFVLPKGVWTVTLTLSFPTNANGSRMVWLSNSSSVPNIGETYYSSCRACDGMKTNVQVTCCLKTTASTTYYVGGKQNSGSSLTVTPRVSWSGFEIK